MKNKQKVFSVLVVIIAGTFITWYVQVYKKNKIEEKVNGDFVATIEPVSFIVREITGNDFTITTLLPPGVSPETYEPTPKQIIDAANAEIFFTIDLLDFEKVVAAKIIDNTDVNVVRLSMDVPLRYGEHMCQKEHDHDHNGVDPHIWTSIDCLKIMAENAYESIHSMYPDSIKYMNNYINLIEKLDFADYTINAKIQQSDIKYFLIYHPSLSYYADDYNIQQVALEVDGKEPSADRIKSVIAQAKQDSIKVILYQQNLSSSVVKTVAEDIGAQAIAFDPLEGDVIENLLRITDIITR